METRCKVCGRILTSAASIKRGAGATCAVHTFEHMPEQLRELELSVYAQVRHELLKKRASKKMIPRKKAVKESIVSRHFGLV